MEYLPGSKLNIVSAIAFSSEVNFLGFFKPEGDKLLRQRKRIAKSDAISKQIETINEKPRGEIVGDNVEGHFPR